VSGGPKAIILIAWGESPRYCGVAHCASPSANSAGSGSVSQGRFVETVRDLAGDDPWRESLERSLARRARSRGVLSQADSRRPRPRPITKRRTTVALGAKGVIGLLLVVAFLAMALDGQAPQVSQAAAHADVIAGRPAYARTPPIVPVSGGAASSGPRTCPLVAGSTGYVNPLAAARVKPERIDQGVDYAGSGSLTAIGAARITHLATDGTGWPGAFIEYRLLNGPDAGCYVFYAEGVTPEPGLRVGDTVSAGQAVATIIPLYETGFEIGWGAGVGTRTYAAETGRWSAADDQDNIASGPGKNFSELIASLGGPPGKVEG
jgi:hypothetical protein